jgi:hypothetical protein
LQLQAQDSGDLTPPQISILIRTGMEKTYAWIAQQYAGRKAGKRVVKD